MYLWFTFLDFCLLLQSPACSSTHSFIKLTLYIPLCFCHVPVLCSCLLSFLVVTSFALVLVFLVYLCGSWHFLYLQGHDVCGLTSAELCPLFWRLFVSRRPCLHVACSFFVFLFWYCILLIILLYSGFLVHTSLFCYLQFWLVFQSHMWSPCVSPSRSPGQTVYWVWLSSVPWLCCHSYTVYIFCFCLLCLAAGHWFVCVLFPSPVWHFWLYLCCILCPLCVLYISCNLILLLKLEFHTINLKNTGKIKTENQCVFPRLLKFIVCNFSFTVISKCPSRVVMYEWVTVTYVVWHCKPSPLICQLAECWLLNNTRIIQLSLCSLFPKLSVDILCISELSVSHPFGRSLTEPQEWGNYDSKASHDEKYIHLNPVCIT